MARTAAFVGFCVGVAATAIGAFGWISIRGGVPGAVHGWLERNPEFLLDNPELVMAARSIAHSRQAHLEATARQALIIERWRKYMASAFAPTLGEPGASRALVEFTDYGCEPCRASAAAVRHTLDSHAELRIVLFLLPTSGDVSEFAARVAFAAYQQNPQRFAQFHESLLRLSGPLTAPAVLSTAADAGFDTEQIEAELGSAQVRQYVVRARQFAQDLNVSGVPSFVLDGRLLAGGVTESQLRAFVALNPGNDYPAAAPDSSHGAGI